MASGAGGVDSDLVDLERVGSWMDEMGLGGGPLTGVAVLGGGTQNVLVRFSRAGRGYVLRRPPRHKRPNSDETMRREARVLEALSASEVPHPGFIAGYPDLDLIGAAFYLMEPVAGVNLSVEVPATLAADPPAQRRLGFAVVDSLLALSRVDFASVGLAELGRPDGWLDRQVPRWQSQLDRYGEKAEYRSDLVPHVAEVGRWLEERKPPEHRVGLVHGDFHIANVLVHPDCSGIAAVVDWELATQGDPLLDLGHLLATWPEQASAAALELDTPLHGLPSVSELIGHYGRHTDRELGHLTWFRVLACYRLAIIIEGTYARSLCGEAPAETGREAHLRSIALLEQARQLMNGGRDGE